MCTFCEPNGWKRNSCVICTKLDVYISISLTIDTDEDNPFPYSRTDLCKDCWGKYGIEEAFHHNRICKESCCDT